MSGLRDHSRSVWLRLGAEVPEPVTGCSADRCDTSAMMPVDVYCGEHERFLPLARELRGRGRVFLAFAVRILLCGAILLAAHLRSPVLFLLAVYLVGVAFYGLPLRLYALNWRFSVSGWVLAGAGTLVLWTAAPLTRRVVATVVLVLVLAAAMYLAGRLAAEKARRMTGKAGRHGWRTHAARWAGAAAGSAALTPAALLTLAAVRWQPPDWYLSTSDGQRWIVAAALGGVTSALFFAAVGGIVLGVTAPIRPARSPLRRPTRPATLRWNTAVATWSTPAAGMFEQLFRVLTAFLTRVAASAVAAARGVANLARTALYVTLTAGVAVVNWVCRVLVTIWRRVVASVAATGRVLGVAAGLAATAGRGAVRRILVPVAGIAVGAWAAHRMSVVGVEYLADGAIADLVVMLVSGGAVVVASGVTWLALCDLPVVGSLRSAARSASLAAANALLLLCVGGWALGLPGTFGPGPISVGWLTLGSTAVLLAGAGTWALRNRARTASKHAAITPAPSGVA